MQVVHFEVSEMSLKHLLLACCLKQASKTAVPDPWEPVTNDNEIHLSYSGKITHVKASSEVLLTLYKVNDGQ